MSPAAMVLRFLAVSIVFNVPDVRTAHVRLTHDGITSFGVWEAADVSPALSTLVNL